VEEGKLEWVAVSELMRYPASMAYETRLTPIPKAFRRSIALAGILDPPTVLEGLIPQVISGFRRVRAMEAMGHAQVLCHIFPAKDGMARKGALQALLANAVTTDFSPVEKARSVMLLYSLGLDQDWIECTLLPALGIGKGKENLRRIDKIAGLPGEILHHLAIQGWFLDVAERYTWFPSEDALNLFFLQVRLRLTASESRKMLEDAVRVIPQLKCDGFFLMEGKHFSTKASLFEYLREMLRLGHVVSKDISQENLKEGPLSPMRYGMERDKPIQWVERQGPFLKRCPGSKGSLCCNYWVFSPLEGCPLSCDYCILQAYLARKPRIELFANWRDGLIELEEKISVLGTAPFRVGTGQLGDSLAMEDVFPVVRELVEFFAGQRAALLELKTKTHQVETLLKAEHAGNVVVAWSLNPQSVVDQYERGCSSLEERLRAARQCQEAGYPVAFHFDPIIDVPDAERLYCETCSALLDMVPCKEIAWISLGTLRFSLSLWRRMIRENPRNPLLFGEFSHGKDGKVRYTESVRFRLLKQILSTLRAVWPKVPYYFCMEDAQTWRTLLGSLPSEIPGLDGIYRR